MSETLTIQEREQFRAFVEKYPDTPLADAMRKWEVALASAEDRARHAIAQAKGLEAERAAQARENETLRARAEKAERRLADANETARRLCRERDALLTAARDLLNAVERGCGVGGFPPWFGDQARALAALAARAPEPQP